MVNEPAATSLHRQSPQPKKISPKNIILSPVTEADLPSLVDGFYTSFPPQLFASIEPPHLRPTPDSLRQSRLATRIKPSLSHPGSRWIKATLAPSHPSFDPQNPNRVVGHAGWLCPSLTKTNSVGFSRRDASSVYGWREKMGWTEEYEDSLWEHVDLGQWQVKRFLAWDKNREDYVGGIGHWYLATLWVVPECQGQGVAGLLMRDGMEVAEEEGEARPVMYLEASEAGRRLYARYGFQAVKGEGWKNVMIMNAPEGVEMMGEDERRERLEAEKGV